MRRTPSAFATQSDEMAVTGHPLVAASGQVLLAVNTGDRNRAAGVPLASGSWRRCQFGEAGGKVVVCGHHT